MSYPIDLRVFELLSSRLCHDIVGPVGAVNNGLEMLEDEELGMADDAVKLVGMSARKAAAALQFYRMAYGMAGARMGLDLSDVLDLASGKLEKNKVVVHWDRPISPEGAPDGIGKLALNIMDLAAESLPRGGDLTVDLRREGAEIVVDVHAAGQGCHLRPEVQEALVDDPSIDDLTPRSVHGYFTRTLARRLGGDLTSGAEGDSAMRFVGRAPAKGA